MPLKRKRRKLTKKKTVSKKFEPSPKKKIPKNIKPEMPWTTRKRMAKKKSNKA